MLTPTVSVLMTAYNRRAFIAEAIDSVLASTYQDFELVIVDDCSTDDTWQVACAYEARDPRVRAVRNERNLGDYPNRNRAARHARGRYLKYLDSDDILYPHALDVMVRAMEQFPDAAFGVMQSGQQPRPFPWRLTPREAYEEQFFERGILFMGPGACIYRRELFEQAGGFEETRHNGDALTALKLARRFPLVKLAPGLMWWREHPDQEFRRRPHHLMMYEVMAGALMHPECPLPPARREAALDRLRHMYARQLLSHAVRHRRPGHAAFMFRASGMPLSYAIRGLVRAR